MKYRFFTFTVFVLGLLVLISIQSPAFASSTYDLTSPNTTIRFSGPFENTYWGIGGTVIIDMNITPTTVSGYINFTNDPDVGILCGAGSFSGTRSGDNFQFSFTSNDSDPGCGIVNGTTFDVGGNFSDGTITNGQFYHPSTGQGGTFTAKQTTRYSGTFSTNGYAGTVVIDIVQNNTNQVTGYMNFTNNPGVPALCGAGSFRGSINTSGDIVYDFLSNDPDSGCGFDDGLEFAVSANLSGNAITNGIYTVVDTGQTGTFSTACAYGYLMKDVLSSESENIAGDVCEEDTTLPSGKIIWPYDYDNGDDPPSDQLYGPGDKIRIEAEAWDVGSNQSGVLRVEFWVGYDGKYHRIKDEYFSPYEADFTIPANLKSQVIRISIHVVDKAGNVINDPGGKRFVDYKQSYNNPGVEENWIPAGNRAYLNQLSLSPRGNEKCGASSATMVLAMNGVIYTDYQSLANKANEIFPYTIDEYNRIMVYLVTNQMTNAGLPSIYDNRTNKNTQWCIIRNEIAAGRPIVMPSWALTTPSGHYFVVVGYKEKVGDSSSREMIVYDPYGEWVGPNKNDYNLNVSIHDENPPVPAWRSRNGQWVYYNFNTARSDWMIVSASANVTDPCNNMVTAIATLSTPSTPADYISEEPDNFGIYVGGEIGTDFQIFLPAITR